MSTLMFWNKQNANNQNNQNNELKNGKRNWLHSPDALLNGHVVYLVKFLGKTIVEQPKGIEVVKDAIRRLQFAQQMKKVDTGNQSKLKKVEITVSVDGVAVQEPRTQKILYQFPLHNISYCADEKGVKKFFSFIAKNGQQQANGNGESVVQMNGNLNSNSNTDEGHECFVFVSSKLASDITLTIGQAFDLAYRRYMNENGKTTELSKIQQQNKHLESTVSAYKNRLKELSEILPKSELDKLLIRLGIRDLFEVPQQKIIEENNINSNKKSVSESSNDEKLLIETSNVNSFVPIIPPRNIHNQINNTLDAFKTTSSQKMDELLLNSDSDSDFDPRAEESENGNKITNDLFGFEPPKTFGQQLFINNNNNNNNSNKNNNNNNQNNNNINNNNNVTNRTISPPPLLAPPPKAAIPRRGTSTNNGGSQDLFGSTPFNPNAPSIFDGNFETDGNEAVAFNILSSSFNESNSKTNDNIEPKYHQNKPSLQLNSPPFGGTDSFGVAFVTNPNITINNPFNESGFYEMNDSINKYNALSDLNALTTNSNKLGGILHNSLSDDNNDNNTSNSGSIAKTTLQQFPSSGGFSLPSAAGIFNPFSIKTESLLSPRGTSNYDALRNSPDLDTMTPLGTNSKCLSSSPIFINNNNNNKNGVHKSGSGLNNDKSPANSFDIFKDVANQAFSEFNSDGKSMSKLAYEFSNKMSGTNFGFQPKSNFSGNNNKPSLVDEFTLESLDPLRN